MSRLPEAPSSAPAPAHTDATPSPRDHAQEKALPAWVRQHRRACLAVAVGALVLVHVALAVTSISYKSLTADEPYHIASGYAIWARGDYRIQPENGVLPQRLMAAPLLLLDVKLPPRASEPWQIADMILASHRFMYEQGNDTDAILWLSRLSIVLFSGGLAVFIFWIARRLFGDVGGLLSLAAYALSPTILAHARLATSDTVTAGMFLVALMSAWWMLHRLSWYSLLLTGLAAGLTVCAKMSGALIGPLMLLLVVLRVGIGRPWAVSLPPIWRGRLRRRAAQLLPALGTLACQAALVVLVIWAMYEFRYSAFESPDGSAAFHKEPAEEAWRIELSGLSTAAPVISLMREHRLLPESYLYGMAYTMRHGQFRAAFLNGEYRYRGWWHFFPYAFAVKTALSLLLLLALLPFAFWLSRRRGHQLYRLLPMLLFLGVYSVMAVSMTLNIGHRHLLPIYPMLCVLVGGVSVLLLRADLRAGTVTKWLPIVALAGLAVESAIIWPHYLAHFNVFAGGPRGAYRHMVDSSLDWGQDLAGLKRWLARHDLDAPGTTGATPVYLSYFGAASPSHYQLDVRRLPDYYPKDRHADHLAPLTPGYYCISATMLQQVYTSTSGRWCQPYEADYQRVRKAYGEYLQARKDPQKLKAYNERVSEKQLRTIVANYHLARFGRLCAALRQREPDATVGHSILIYRVSAKELRRALMGPPPELHEQVTFKD